MSGEYYILLTGAIKNVGDFLIADRSKKLFSSFVSNNFYEFNRWENFEDKLDVINNAKAVIMCGGPGYASNMYPDIYPLVNDLSKLKVPIIPLGVGWSGQPRNNPLGFRFSSLSRKLMDYIHNFGLYSCRDILTEEILKKEGYNQVVMTGCPVWYDLDFIGKPFKTKKDIRKIVFTTPASPKLLFETIRVMKFLRDFFPESEIIVTFHRGIKRDKHTSFKTSLMYTLMAEYGKFLGFEIKDVSYDLSKIEFYNNMDLHIGYRVHAHLYFLSKRLPSILICEDGRGIGMSKTLKLPVFLSRSNNLLSSLERYLRECIETNFENQTFISQFIDEKFFIMKEFLSKISLA